MNIIEETTEKYRYNGVVSMKALEDDIVTLENLIESNTLLVDEARLRGFVIKSLVTKINEDKEKLNLLKVIRNREVLKTKKDDGISGVLGASAKNANGTALPETAASKKQPLLQNFEKAEYEIVEEQGDTSIVNSPNDEPNDIVVGKTLPDTTEISSEATENKDVDKNKDNIVSRIEAEKIEPLMDAYPVQEKPMEREDFVSYEMDRDKVNEEERLITHNDSDFIARNQEIPSEDIIKEEDKNTIKMEKTDYSDSSYESMKQTDEELSDFYVNLSQENILKTEAETEPVASEREVPSHDCPPPTIDDYMEPVEVPGTYEAGRKENEELTTYCQEDEKPETRNSVEYKLDLNPETLSPQPEKENNQEELSIYYPFPEEDHDEETELIVSVGLHDITNMVNTTYTTLYHDIQKRELTVRFFNVRDYEVFIALLKKMEKERRNPFTRLLKKQGSIFMNVTVKVGDNEQKYSYEFTNCKLKDIFDTEYVTSFEHECSVKFKYKKLKIK